MSREFQVTRERIRQIEAKALRMLRHPSRSKKQAGRFGIIPGRILRTLVSSRSGVALVVLVVAIAAGLLPARAP